jgi:hypothetical protein
MSVRFAQHLDSLLVKAIVRMRNLKPSQILFDTYAWRWGANRYVGMLDIAKDFTLDPARITCPLLSLVARRSMPTARSAGDSRTMRSRPTESQVAPNSRTGVRGADGPVIGPKVPYRRCLHLRRCSPAERRFARTSPKLITEGSTACPNAV